jgi:hypothetical protein
MYRRHKGDKIKTFEFMNLSLRLFSIFEDIMSVLYVPRDYKGIY